MSTLSSFLRVDGAVCHLSGSWRLATIGGQAEVLRRALDAVPPAAAWDLSNVALLDSFGATLLWHAWKQRWPTQVKVSESQRAIIDSIAQAEQVPLPAKERMGWVDAIAALGVFGLNAWEHLLGCISLLGQLLLDFFYLVRYPKDWPLKEISAVLYKSGVQALPVSALVGFLIGVGLAYLSALQLQMVGADVFIINILGLGIIRELGPLLAALLVAGRSGSAMTAQLGVMKVTEEMDALVVMGGSRSLRLIFPKVLALSIAMPGVVIWTCAMALLGGMVAAYLQLDMALAFFLDVLPRVVRRENLWIALSKAWVFGFLIALIASYYGLRVKPNTESLSTQTTASVVTAITVVILVDVVFAILLKDVGIR